MRLLFTFICLFALTIIAPHANAAAINEAGANRLKAVFTEMLETQAMAWGAQSEVTLEQQGSLTVEQADKYYAITFPHMQIRQEDGSRIEIGIISANAAPHDAPGQWKMTYALPTPIRGYDAQDNETWRAEIKGQQAAGIFHDTLQQFSKLDATYSDISIQTLASTTPTTIGKIVLRFDFDEDTQKLWSGPGYIEANTIKTQSKDKKSSVEIGSIKGTFAMDQYDPQAGIDYQKRFLALQKQGAFETGQMSEEHEKELSSMLADLYTKGMDGFDFTYALSDFSLTKPASLDGEQETFTLDNTNVSMNTGGFLSDKAQIGFGFGFEGLSVSSITADKQDILPSTANIDIQLKDIPFTQLTEAVQNALAGANNNLQIAGFGLLVRVPALLSQAGTRIEIKDNHLGSALYRLDLNGEIIADITATNSATAKAILNFTGLDTLLNKIKTHIANPETKEKDLGMLTQASDNLEWLKTLGTQDGKKHIFEFIMNAQGETLLNGHDIRTLQPGQPITTPPTTPSP